MSTNMTLITSVTVGSGGAASVTLPATGTIPQTYTDLKVVISARDSGSGISRSILLTFNNSGSGYSNILLYGNGSSAVSATSTRGTDIEYLYSVANGATANTFSNSEIYIPNYTSSNNKSVSIDCVIENNATSTVTAMSAGLWANSAAITTIKLTSFADTFVEGSTFYLYGISNVTSTTKATGGIVSSDGTYNYHMFPYSGTFTPTTAFTADILTIAGGGGGGGSGAGGGAGGLVYLASQSLTAQNYTCTVGAGGSGGLAQSQQGYRGSNGVNSQFGSLTAAVGGGGGGGNDLSGQQDGNSGGSGGGGGSFSSTSGTGGAGTSGQGNTGGNGSTDGATYRKSGGGGGAGAAAANAGNNFSTDGGAGVNTYSSWATATQTGVNGYYAGGGGASPGKVGGLGGGGAASVSGSAENGTSGVVNTGGGGGASGFASGGTAYYGGSGGSGLIIIRYAI